MQNTVTSSDRSQIARLAVIGLGMIGKKHAEIAQQLPTCDLTAVCDITRTAKETADRLGATFYTDYHEMLEREELDGVILAIPTDVHVPVGMACARKGVHLLVEKPIAASVSEAERLIATARQHQVQLLVGHYRRFNPFVEMSRKIVRGGKIGKLVGVTILWTLLKPPEYFQASWRKGQGGGPILINLIHDIDNLRSGALTEVGNILINSVVGTVSNVLERPLRYTPPVYEEEPVMGLLTNEREGDPLILLARTNFVIRQMQIQGNLMLLFELDSFDSLMAAVEGSGTW